MNSSESGTRRARKRQASDSNLSPEDLIKKEKNREAARKCRQKKQTQADDLKRKNKELEEENRKLADDKSKLQSKVDGYLKIIRDHVTKGCEIPADVEPLWKQEDGNVDLADFQPVAIMEAQRSTPPTTPESISSDTTSPPSVKSTDVLVGSSMSSASPVGLFGGSPLQVTVAPMKTTRVRTNSQSNRSSQSSLSPSPSATQSPSDLSHYLQLKQVPQALEPIQPGQNCVVFSQTPRLAETYMNGNHGPSLPTVVSEYVDINNVSDAQTHTLPVHTSGVDSQLVMEQAFAHPPILTQDPISSNLYQLPNGADNMPENNEIQTNNENLPSTGFQFQSAPEGYSFSEDLCRAEAPGEIIGQISLANPVEPSQSTNKEPVNQSMPTIMAQAQALLSLDRISPSLKQQIMSLSTQAQTSSTASADQAYVGTVVNQQLTTQQNVKQWIDSSPKSQEQMILKHTISPMKNLSTVSGGQFFKLSELARGQRGQVQVIKLGDAQSRGMNKQNVIMSPTSATRSNGPTVIIQQRQSSEPSSPGQVTVQKVFSPQTSTTAGQQFTASSTIPHILPSATVLATLPGASQNWVTVQEPQIIPSPSIQDSIETSSNNPMPCLPSLDMGNLPSITFTDFESESNIFEKKPKKSS